MSFSVEWIKAKSNKIKENRKHFFDKLIQLQDILSNSLDGIEVFARSDKVTLEMLSEDDWIYGYLSYSNGKLEVAFRSTEDDFIDSMKNVPSEYWNYDVKELDACPIKWLERLSTEKSINNLLKSIEKSLDNIEDESQTSIKSLEVVLESQSNVISDDAISVLKEFDDDNLHRDWLKARSMIQMDPSDSITRTSSYLESVCRKILSDQNVDLPQKKDISNLVSATVNIIKISEDREAKNDLKQLFGGIKSIFQSIGALRTHFGSAHGASPRDYEIDQHCARLASDAAAAVSIFLLQRYKKMKKP